MKKYVFSLVLLAVVLCLGCSKNLKVSGKVTFSDGSPVTFGTVAFVTDTFYGSGAISSDGTYVMGSTKERDGLPPGTYKVYIENSEEITTVPGATEKDPPKTTSKERIAKKFTRPTETPLSCEVKGATVYNITVEKP